MNIVYLISRGSYDDKRVIDVCSSQEKADETARGLRLLDDDVHEFVEPFAIDNLIETARLAMDGGYRMYEVDMTLDGRAYLDDVQQVREIHKAIIVFPTRFSITLLALSEEHAIERAKQKRREHLGEEPVEK